MYKITMKVKNKDWWIGHSSRQLSVCGDREGVGALKIPHIVGGAPNFAEFKSGGRGRKESERGGPWPVTLIVILALLASLQCVQFSGGALEMTISGRFSAFQWTHRRATTTGSIHLR